MPRFFFDVHNGSSVVSDLDGELLPETQTARSVAARRAIDLARSAVQNEFWQSLAVVVRDEGGVELNRVRLIIEWH
jgi:hypothetical protein